MVEGHLCTILEYIRYGSKRIIKLKEGEPFKQELQRAGIQETQIFQMQLAEKPD
ncbi:hypothetical protein LAV77_14975 [Priestia megaterium]|uniref:hypothetical protein n=1 Tax=Priestia megaterium TaxID=1404 RepID=UPI002B24C8CB|nr:hypothetical protein [Priestia megaterium]MEB2266107.1 hypothetical protein [Priestia megaterium]